MYHRQDLHSLGIDVDFVQDNHSLSYQTGTLRGLHFQAPPTLRTSLYVAVADLFSTSRLTLDAVVQRLVSGLDMSYQVKMGISFFAKGFAHGFMTLEPDTEIIYKCSDYYAPRSEGSLRWDDPDIGICWQMMECPF